MSEEFDYGNDLKIDLNTLHLDNQTHAERFAKWGKLWAKAGRKMRRAEEKVKTIRSEWVLELKMNFKEYGFSKEPTGPQSEAFYRTQDNYKDAKKEQIELQSDRDDYFIAKEAFKHRKESLRDEGMLYHDEYWSLTQLEPDASAKLRRDDHEKELEGGSDRIPK